MPITPVDGEPQFTLLARDRLSPDLIRQWAYERERHVATGLAPQEDLAKIEVARAIATKMEVWRIANDGAWRKPVPEPVAPSQNDEEMLTILGDVAHAITTGELGGYSVRIAGIDVQITYVDMDTKKLYESARAAGEFAVHKDAVLTPIQGFQQRRFGQYGQLGLPAGPPAAGPGHPGDPANPTADMPSVEDLKKLGFRPMTPEAFQQFMKDMRKGGEEAA